MTAFVVAPTSEVSKSGRVRVKVATSRVAVAFQVASTDRPTAS